MSGIGNAQNEIHCGQIISKTQVEIIPDLCEIGV